MRTPKQYDEYIKANRKGSREAEIEMYGKPLPKHKVHQSKKVYDRKRMKADERRLPSFYLLASKRSTWTTILLSTIILFFVSFPLFSQSVFERAGMVDIQQLDSTIQVHLVYATPDNFTGKTVYTDLTRAWLLPEVAKKVIKAQQLLKSEHPSLSLIVYDAARPLSVQQQFWDLVKGTDQQKYVSNPANGGGLHNYGAAVDVTIVDEKGNPLPMGTVFDHFGPEAGTNNERALVAKGLISREELNNRLLLRKVMHKAGLTVHPEEWWHFNAYTRDYAKKHLKIVP